MFNFFKNIDASEKNSISIISLACLLINAARIDQSYTDKEKKIIKETLLRLGANKDNIDDILIKAEEKEENSNQILEFTKEAKNLDQDKKIIILKALWEIIYSDENADIYETNLMRRLSGLLYIDKKIFADIKEKIKNKKL